MHDDSELLRRYTEQQSEAAFGELVERHLPAVYAVALRRVGGNAPLAQDVCQAVFSDLARKAAPLSRHGSVAGWLFVATRFAAAKAVRADQAQQLMRAGVATLIATMGNEAEDWSELRPMLDAAVQELSEPEREAILLHFYGRRTFRDIGVALRVSESGARMRVERALEKLRRRLIRLGVASTAAALGATLANQAGAALPEGLNASVHASAMAAAAAAPPVSATLLLMTITKTHLAAALAVALVAMTTVGVMQEVRLSSLRRQVAALTASSASADRRARALQRRLDTQRSVVASLRDQLKPVGSGNASGANSGSGARSVTVRIADILRDHPEYRALMTKEYRRYTVLSHAKAIAALNLPPEEAKKLKELYVEQDESATDAEIAASEAGIDPNSDEGRKAIEDASKAAKQGIVALIGAAAADQVEAMVESQFQTQGGYVGDGVADMADAGVPPTDDQATNLAQLVHDLGDSARNPAAKDSKYKTPDPTTWLSPYDQQVLAQAANFLSPVQVNILSSSRADRNHMSSILNSYSQGGNMMIEM